MMGLIPAPQGSPIIVETGPRCGTCRWYMLPPRFRFWANGSCRHRPTSEIERRIGKAEASPFDGFFCVCYRKGRPMRYKRDLEEEE